MTSLSIVPRPPTIDLDLIAKQLQVALDSQRDAESAAQRHEGLAASARETSKMRRIEIGKLLTTARTAWPTRGPNAKGWGEFLAAVKLDDATARRYMDEFRDPAEFERKRAAERGERGERDLKPANVNGGSGDPTRGSYCTPKKYAYAVGSWDLDPFSNPRSHIVAARRCMLENGGNGLLDATAAGSYVAVDGQGVSTVSEAMAGTRVWIQPPYELVLEALAHYAHTRFCALLRLDPSTRWFAALWPLTACIAIPLGERIEFEGPPDVETSANPYPHAFYYRDERDITPAIRSLCVIARAQH